MRENVARENCEYSILTLMIEFGGAFNAFKRKHIRDASRYAYGRTGILEEFLSHGGLHVSIFPLLASSDYQ